MQILIEFTNLLHKYGSNSIQIKDYLKKHTDVDFQRRAEAVLMGFKAVYE